MLLLNVACSTGSSKKADKTELSGVKLTEQEKEKMEDYKAEVEMGRNMAGRLLQYYGSYGDQDLLGYINQVGNYVAGYGDYPDRRYMFAVIDTEMVNAFACPGGYILVTLGTLRNAKTEAELAAVLGHETVHVGKQHMFKSLKKMRKKEMDRLAEENEKKGKIKISPALEARRRPEPKSKSELASLVARYAGGGASAGFSILRAAKAGMSIIMEEGLDKRLEYEADNEGVKYAVRAGYEPVAMLRFLSRLARKKRSLNMEILEKTHPSIKDRKKHIVAMLRKMKAADIVGATGKERYQKYKNKLPTVKKS